MSVDTKGRLIGKVTHEQILNFIKQKYDKDAFSGVKKEYYDYNVDWEHIKYGDENHYVESGFIYFKTLNGNKRQMFYYYSNINHLDNLKFYSECGLKDMVMSEVTILNLGCNTEAVEIMRDVVTEFGGWIDENDCDDKEYYPVLKNPDGTIKEVIYVTMEEVYEKFGGVVIIKK